MTNLGDHCVLDLDGGTSWTHRRRHPNPKDHFSTAVLNGKIYALGGEHGHDLLNGSRPTCTSTTRRPTVDAAGEHAAGQDHIEAATFV